MTSSRLCSRRCSPLRRYRVEGLRPGVEDTVEVRYPLGAGPGRVLLLARAPPWIEADEAARPAHPHPSALFVPGSPSRRSPSA